MGGGVEEGGETMKAIDAGNVDIELRAKLQTFKKRENLMSQKTSRQRSHRHEEKDQDPSEDEGDTKVVEVTGDDTKSLQPLRTKIRLWWSRSERGKYKTCLEDPVHLPGKKRSENLGRATLRGFMASDVDVLTMQIRIVSCLISSAFTNTEWERNLFLQDVMPYVQNYSRRQMFEIKLV